MKSKTLLPDSSCEIMQMVARRVGTQYASFHSLTFLELETPDGGGEVCNVATFLEM